MNSDSVSYVAAFGGGLVSFLSPCVLPLVPAYLSIITGLDVTEPGDVRHRWVKVARDTGLFILGFGSVFVLLGLSATSIGRVLFRNQVVLTRVSGLVVVAMALFILGSLVLRSPWLYQEKRFHPDLSRFGPFAAPVAGVAFGFGWTPCIGPVLTSILALAASGGDAGQGAALLAVYSAGLGVPFLATGLAFSRLAGALAWVKRHFTAVTVASAGSLAFFGVLLVLDRLVWMTARLQEALDAVGLDRLVELG
ncbi:MAG: cytochrome c biogenesis CcdA family protein [Microbacteriaceae bacterium]